MRRSLWLIGLAALAAGLVWALAPALSSREEPQVQARLITDDQFRSAPSAQGFARAEGPVTLDFPTDLGPHPDFLTEWWYYTGNLETSAGERFGYQLTFFRRALIPPGQRQDRSSSWASNQVYLAHFTLTDVTGGRFRAFERLARGAAGLAGAAADPYRVWLEDWEVRLTGDNAYRLQARAGEVAVDLLLRDLKGPILQGDRGYSQKGPQAGNASYYYSQTRLETRGQIQVNGNEHAVSGLSWKDHEYSTSVLSPGQVGWDWFSMQLEDGSEIMVYQIRRSDGQVDPFSSGTVVRASGSTRALEAGDFAIQVEDTWVSPHSGARYPSKWRVSIPSEGLELEISPALADQELNLTYIYWEGAVDITGEREGRPIAGRGYVELTGYAGSFAGDF